MPVEYVFMFNPLLITAYYYDCFNKYFFYNGIALFCISCLFSNI